jgi:hypothetical protein
MRRVLFRLWLGVMALLPGFASASEDPFSFALIANAFRYAPDERALRQNLKASQEDSLAFIVANGIKSDGEPCSDELYMQRRALYDKAGKELILTLAANDWAECRRNNGESAAVERLQRVREIFFTEPVRVAEGTISVARQSTTEKFRIYSENLRWQVGPVWFATLNLPANNNHYLNAAGRNNEFEDRLVANEEWLQRLFTLAKASKARGIVLFTEANPIARPSPTSPEEKARDGKARDGFTEIRRQLLKLSSGFKGKVLIVHNGKPSRWASLHKLSWRGNLGEIGMLTGWARISVHPNHPLLFAADLQADQDKRGQ